MAAEAIPWQFLASAQLLVTHIDSVTEAETVLAFGDDYSVAGSGPDGSASLTALAAWPADDDWRVERVTVLEQEYEIPPFEALRSSALEREVDRQTMVAQELFVAYVSLSERSLQFPNGELAQRLPSKSSLAGKFLAFDNDGNPIASSGTGADAGLRTDLIAAPGAGLTGFSHAAANPAGTVGAHLKAFICVTDAPYNAPANGVANDSPAFLAAVDDLPAEGGDIWVPSGFTYNLEESIPTGTTKRVSWKVGACLILLPPGEHGFLLQSNGSHAVGVGRWAARLRHRAPVVPMVRPTLTAVLTMDEVSGVTASGGSGMRSPPVLFIANSPHSAAIGRPDAGAVAKLTGDTVTTVTVPGGASLSGGFSYIDPPAVTQWAGGAAAIVIDGAQGCKVSGFSFDYDGVDGAVGLLHIGGWWCDVSDLDEFYDVATGVSTGTSTTTGLLSVSIDSVVPGPTGAYEANYVCSYRRLHLRRAAVVGHGTSTATTIKFDDCDIKNLALHACVSVTLSNYVSQPPSGTVGIDMLNTAGVTWFGGDLESEGTGFRHVGSCTNTKVIGPVKDGLIGPVHRGEPGQGSYFDWSDSDDASPTRHGLTRSKYRGANWLQDHSHGLHFSGGVFVMGASNLLMLSETQGELTDTASGGFAITITTSGVMRLYTATAGANPRALSQFGQWSGDQIEVGGGGLYVAGAQIIKFRQPALPPAATDLPTALTLLNAMRATQTAGGGGHQLYDA